MFSTSSRTLSESSSLTYFCCTSSSTSTTSLRFSCFCARRVSFVGAQYANDRLTRPRPTKPSSQARFQRDMNVILPDEKWQGNGDRRIAAGALHEPNQRPNYSGAVRETREGVGLGCGPLYPARPFYDGRRAP